LADLEAPVPVGELADEIRAVGRRARSEEDLRIGIEELLAPVRRRLGITPRYETSYRKGISVLGGGYSDAVYGHAVLEYKRPGVLSRDAGVQRAAEELERYLTAEAAQYGSNAAAALQRVVGIALDGERMFFLRHRAVGPAIPGEFTQLAAFGVVDRSLSPGFERSAVVEISEDSVGLLLTYLRALRRKALTPESLALQFGPSGDVARSLVPAFVARLRAALQGDSPADRHTQTFYAEWARRFGVVYGDAPGRRWTQLEKLYNIRTAQSDYPLLLFAIHTYYALLMKLLAAELASLQSGSMVSSMLASLRGLKGGALTKELADLEAGGLFTRLGIRNFLEGDFFGWYVAGWDPSFEGAFRDLIAGLSEYEPATGTILPAATRDLLKKLYQYLLPSELRHDLGEYYTPDWLAEVTLDRAGYDGDPDKRFLDPACGSGTFLVLAIKRLRSHADRELMDPETVVRQILANVVGFDLNPLAVTAARTNYLLALGGLLRYAGDFEIPVYLCDSVLVPSSEDEDSSGQTSALFTDYKLETSVGSFNIPKSVVATRQLSQLSLLLEDGTRYHYSKADFDARARRELVSLGDADLATVSRLFERMTDLEEQGRDGVWARILRNAFAPVMAGRFDYVVGDPPWIRWTYISRDYRQATDGLWRRYGLFSLGGMAARLGGGDKDFATLFVYASADRYLRDGGRLAFLMPLEALKGKGAGFRRFRIGTDGPLLQVIEAHDLVDIQPFEGAKNKTAMIVLRKGARTEYPIPYVLWERLPRVGPVSPDGGLQATLDATKRTILQARPVGPELTSAWLTLREEDQATFAPLSGKSAYSARRGAGTDPYGVFQLKVEDVRGDGLLLVENLTERGLRTIPKVHRLVERELVYPAVRGSDVQRWFARPAIYVLVSQDPGTRKPYSATHLKSELPRTYAYLDEFREILLSRGSSTVRQLAERTEPWAMFGIGGYSFAPFRVVWRRMASDLVAAVVSDWHTPFGNRPVLATETTSFVPLENEDEAHFLCALLNSSIVRSYVKSFSSSGRGFGAPSILSRIRIDRYDPTNPAHRELSQLGRQAQVKAQADPLSTDSAVATKIDRAVAGLYAIDADTDLEDHSVGKALN
jgi:SAM-dependent methyltransferase